MLNGWWILLEHAVNICESYDGLLHIDTYCYLAIDWWLNDAWMMVECWLNAGWWWWWWWWWWGWRWWRRRRRWWWWDDNDDDDNDDDDDEITMTMTTFFWWEWIFLQLHRKYGSLKRIPQNSNRVQEFGDRFFLRWCISSMVTPYELCMAQERWLRKRENHRCYWCAPRNFLQVFSDLPRLGGPHDPRIDPFKWPEWSRASPWSPHDISIGD